MPDSQVTTLQRIAWALLIAATLYICYFSNLNAIGFVGPDEPRYAWIARDMAETGDWVTPRLYGRPWFEKPPLLYWGGAIFFKLMPSQPEVAARLPSAICALLATLALAWLAWRTYGEECARWLLLLLPTSVGMIGFSHACATDMPFAAMLTIALVCAAVVLGIPPPNENTPILPRTPWLALLLFGSFLGLAVLAKGPAGLILTGGAVFFWSLFTKRWRDALRLLHPAAIATFCATALPWYILCSRRNPDFFRIFIIEHNFKRYLTPEFQHIQPFWFYIPIVLLALLPWMMALFWAMAGMPSRRPDALAPLLICSSIFCIVFFSVSSSKLPGYVLPCIPLLFLFMVQDLSYRARLRGASSRRLAIATAFLLLAPGLAWVWLEASFFFLSGQSGVAPSVRLRGSLFVVGGVLSLACGLFDRVRIAFLATAVTMIALVAGIRPALKLADSESIRSALQQTQTKWPSFNAAHSWSYQLHRSDQYSLNFYLHREVPEWSPESHQEGWIFGMKRLTGSAWVQEMDCLFITKGDAALQRVVCREPADSLGGPERGRKSQ